MSMVGGMPSHGVVGNPMSPFNSGHSASMQNMYGAPPATAHSERPFRCDQCPQSFNRNHDLKRHKRIHLAVKPFPCTFCDKSFSRKDALKVGFFLLFFLFSFLLSFFSLALPIFLWGEVERGGLWFFFLGADFC